MPDRLLRLDERAADVVIPDEAHPQRNIRGVATGEETQELLEEGIAVMPLPIPPHKDWH